MGQALQTIFGDVIRTLRKEKKVSQERLAVDSDLQRSFISRLERGKTQPTLITIFELSKALNVDPADIIILVQRRWKDGNESHKNGGHD
ncbi:MAG: helix-turn-helix transcriptional regulator [Geobacteraceae bacterium]|jgi:transcriptional regulator with XRE-family HTH domain